MRRSTLARPLLILLLVPPLALLTPGLASAQEGTPSPTERAVTLVSPAVVFIDLSVQLKVVLTYSNPNAVSGLGSLNRSYSFDYATGSGFVVTPSGAIVTASHVVEPEQQAMQNYGANKMVLEGWNYTYPSQDSSPFDQYTLPIGYRNQLLQQCYKGVACDFTITPIVTVFSPVDIAQTQLPKGAPARVLTSTGFENTDVAVLQVNGANMPTAALAQTAGDLASGDEVTGLGFPGSSRDALQTGQTQPANVFGHVSNIRSQGTSKLIEVDANIEPGMSGGPAVNSAGEVIGLISFYLRQSSGESAAKYLRTIDDIRLALADAGVTPARGPVDDAFAKAMDLYWANHFTAAVPQFERALALYDGFPLAKEFLASSQAKAGTAEDIPLASPSKVGGEGGGFPVWAIGAIAVGAVVVLLLMVIATRRRRPAPVAPPAAAPPTSLTAVGVPAPPPAEAQRAVGFRPAATAPAPPSAQTFSPPQPHETGTENEVRAGAGEDLPHFCSACGHKLEADARFCPSCGHVIKA
jgi:S1-C subfamily serine protease